MSRWVAIARLGMTLLLIAVVAASCTKGSPSPTPSSSSPSISIAPSPTVVKLPKAVPCTITQLSVVSTQFKSHTKSASGVFVFTNTSTTQPCWMKGYPGLQMLDVNGKAIPTHVKDGSGEGVPSIAVGKVVLKPAAGASFIFGYSTVASGSQTCPTSSKVGVSPPGLAASIKVVFGMNPCGGDVIVSPVRSSTTL